jgi:hypothetical protein
MKMLTLQKLFNDVLDVVKNRLNVNAHVQVNDGGGIIPEYGWVDGEPEPEPEGFAFGAQVDPSTNEITVMYWDGSTWKAVE